MRNNNMEKEYTVGKIIEMSDAKFGKRVRLELEGEGVVTLFTKWPENLIPNSKIYGKVSETSFGKDFKFGNREQKADAGPAANNAGLAEIKNLLTFKIIPMLEVIHKENIIISEKLGIEDENDMPSPQF